MSLNEIRHALTKPQKLKIIPNRRVIDGGLLAIGIVFMQYLISVEKPDQSQTLALVFFCIAIPFTAFHLFFTQTLEKIPIPVSAYLAKSFNASFIIGSFCTFLGISNTLIHFSSSVATVFIVCCYIVVILGILIYKDQMRIYQKLEAIASELEKSQTPIGEEKKSVHREKIVRSLPPLHRRSRRAEAPYHKR